MEPNPELIFAGVGGGWGLPCYDVQVASRRRLNAAMIMPGGSGEHIPLAHLLPGEEMQAKAVTAPYKRAALF